MLHSRRHVAFTVTEVLVAFALFTILLTLLMGAMRLMGRGEERFSRADQAVAHAEIALAHLMTDLRCMAPPDPGSPSPVYRLDPSGHGLTFVKLEDPGSRWTTRSVTYEVRPAGSHGNLHLYRDGARIPRVMLRELTVAEETPARVDSPDGNPILRIRITGVGADLSPAALGPSGIHSVEIDLPVPMTTPLAIHDLPRVARTLIARSVESPSPS